MRGFCLLPFSGLSRGCGASRVAVVMDSARLALGPLAAQSCQGVFTASQAPNPGRKVGLEVLGMAAPCPGVFGDRAGFQRCHLGGRDPVLAVGFLAGDRGWQLGQSCALLSLSWQAWPLFWDVFQAREKSVPAQLGAGACAGTPGVEQASKGSRKSQPGGFSTCRQLGVRISPGTASEGWLDTARQGAGNGE